MKIKNQKKKNRNKLLLFSVVVACLNGFFVGSMSASVFAASSLNVTIANTISLDIMPKTAAGTFTHSSTSDNTVSVSTNNYTGYTLGIAASTANDNALSYKENNTTVDSINSHNVSAGVSETNYANDSYASSNNLNNTWGYRPSKYNSEDNTTTNLYYPAPTSTTILDTTSVANPTASNNYNIAIGAKVGLDKTPGAYTNTFVITVVANPTPYTITYNANAGTDTVTNMPSNVTNGLSDADTVNVDNPANPTIPTRTGYNFAGWCKTTDVTSQSACSGTLYNTTNNNLGNFPIDSNASSNNISVSAIWTPIIYTQTVNYYYQTATGTSGTVMTYTEDVAYGSNFTFTSAKAASFNSTTHSTTMYTANNGTTSTTINYTVTGPTTNTVYFNRNTRTVALTKGTGISAVTVTGDGVKSGSGTASATVYYGGAATIAATLSSNYDWVNWTGSATYTNQSQSVTNITSNLSFTANGKTSKLYFQNATSANCGSTMYDNRGVTAYRNVAYTTAMVVGLCWMTRNLDLPGGTTLTPSDSNVTSNYTLPTSSTSGFSDNSMAYVYNSDSTNFNDTSCGQDNPCYSYYSYAAATAGTNPSSGEASSDICPKGWRLPTRAELNTLYSSYNTGEKLVAAPFLAVIAGYYNSSSFYGGWSSNYWSSTANDASHAYDLYYINAYATVGYTDKYMGDSVRCVAKA